MGVDTKGFLLTSKKNPFQIWKIIKDALIDDMMEQSGATRQTDLWLNDESGYTCPTARIHDFSEMISVRFEYKGEQRDLTAFLDCDHDYEYVRKGKKIIVSLGAWGSSVHLIEVVLKALQKELGGKVFMVNGDSTEDWRPV